jgi:hypothetical protein
MHPFADFMDPAELKRLEADAEDRADVERRRARVG